MRLNDVINGIAITDRRGRLDCEITGITPDSRNISGGELFVAVRGLSADGHEFVGDAVSRGAAAVLAESWSPDLDKKFAVPPHVVLVPNSRRAVALSAANYYGQPSRKLLIAGVTGTNGKTTVTYVLESIMRAASRTVGVIGTVSTRFGGNTISTDHTTPDAVALQRTLAEMRDGGVTHVVMEVSSHALDQQRVAGVHFKVAGFTNLTHDHLDYHKSVETYLRAKSRLFSETLRKSRARGRMAVVNIDDENGEELIAAWGGKSLRVTMNPDCEGDVVALSMNCTLDGTSMVVRTPKGEWELDCPLIGRHNVSNVLVAMGMALAMGFSKARIVRGLRGLERVPGRLEAVPNEDGKRVFVDYAHTPDALKHVLQSLRPMTKGRLIVVFGCGGDRDKAKRPKMGAAVAANADLAIVTNDNPRTEDPNKIIAKITKGLESGGFSKMGGAVEPKRYVVEAERREAIRKALAWAEPDDVVIIAGKGHESYQIVGREKRYFDDREEARRMLAGLPPPLPADVPATEIDDTQYVDADDITTTEIAADDIEAISEAEGPVTAEVSLDDIEAIVADEVSGGSSGARFGGAAAEGIAADAAEVAKLDAAEPVIVRVPQAPLPRAGAKAEAAPTVDATDASPAVVAKDAAPTNAAPIVVSKKSAPILDPSEAPAAVANDVPPAKDAAPADQAAPSAVATEAAPSAVATEAAPSAVATEAAPSAVATEAAPSAVATEAAPSAVATHAAPGDGAKAEAPADDNAGPVASGDAVPATEVAKNESAAASAKEGEGPPEGDGKT